MNVHPIDYFNFHGVFRNIFKGIIHNMLTDNECALGPELNKTTFEQSNNYVTVIRENPYGFQKGGIISKFQLLCAISFKHDHQQAISWIQHELMGEPIPYIRVGVDYFKVIHKDTRYGGNQTQIKHWTKDEIKQDHTKQFLNLIPKFDDFTIIPNNNNYQPTIKNCYNLYSEFSHKPHPDSVTAKDCPVTINFLQHIFQEHFELSLIYFQVLYLYPRQILPILCLVSRDNETGKTTFLNFIEMIFGGNFVLISPDDLTKNFNSNYATKNIIGIEETFMEKQTGVEKLKSLSTGKSIQMARKFIDDQPLPFFAKIILNTNKIKDFMRLDSKEIRFWVREVPLITGIKNTQIEQQLFHEIPKFLRLLKQLPDINFNNGSRMVFTKEQLITDSLLNLKNESRSGLFKELEMFIEDFFNQNPNIKSFRATPIDIKEHWFRNDIKISAHYIKKVLNDEVGMVCLKSKTGKAIKYYRFGKEDHLPNSINPDYKTGFPFEFQRLNEPDPD